MDEVPFKVIQYTDGWHVRIGGRLRGHVFTTRELAVAYCQQRQEHALRRAAGSSQSARMISGDPPPARLTGT